MQFAKQESIGKFLSELIEKLLTIKRRILQTPSKTEPKRVTTPKGPIDLQII